MKDKKIIEKYKELVSETNRFGEYLNKAIIEGRGDISDWEEVFDVKLSRIKALESEIAALESTPDEVCYPAKFINDLLESDIFINGKGKYVWNITLEVQRIFDTLPELLAFWRELPENKDK